ILFYTLYIQRREESYMRQRYKPWVDDYLRNNSQLVLPNAHENKNNWQSVFNNQNPLHLEIATGTGQFLVGMATKFHDVNFIGRELGERTIVSAAQKMIEEKLDNVLLLNENAIYLSEFFAPTEIPTIYLNFSDPWPKNRHEKRRLTYYTFLGQYN